MHLLENLKGCGTAMVTPFRADGSLDERTLASFVEWQIKEGIHFLVPCGTTEAIAESTDLPIIIYNVPGRTSSNILPDTQLRLAEIPNLLGVKEASGDISQIGEICTRAPRKFRILSGDDALTLPVIALGGHGIISVASNEVPGMMAKFTEACLDGRWDEARDWNRKLYPLMRANFIESSPIPVKAALAMMGKITEAYRLPLVNISDGNRPKLAAVLADLKLI